MKKKDKKFRTKAPKDIPIIWVNNVEPFY